MSPDFYSKAADLAARAESFAIATVIRVEGSSSAARGSKALIGSSGKLLAGWVGGGCAESAVRSEAIKSLETGAPRTITLDMTDEQLGIGMPCGGTMEVFIEPVLPRPELLIVGHGRIAETLSALGHLLGFSITVNDPAADQAAFPQADKIVTEDFDLTETPIGPKTFVVIATQHKRDHLWLQKALEGSAIYVALIASHIVRLWSLNICARPVCRKRKSRPSTHLPDSTWARPLPRKSPSASSARWSRCSASISTKRRNSNQPQTSTP
jgi:xanthine dehydrogenase accessory factor